MRNKMVTLCPTTYEKAQNMDNFSRWVREKLLEDSGPMEEVRKYFARCNRCETQFSSYNRKRVPSPGFCPVCTQQGRGDGSGDIEVWSEKESDL
jgi:hypothetical protein